MKSPSQAGPGLSWTISCEHLVLTPPIQPKLSARVNESPAPLQLHIDEALFFAASPVWGKPGMA